MHSPNDSTFYKCSMCPPLVYKHLEHLFILTHTLLSISGVTVAMAAVMRCLGYPVKDLLNERCLSRNFTRRSHTGSNQVTLRTSV